MRNILLLASLVLVAGCAAEEEDIQLSPDFDAFSKAAALTWNDAYATGDADALANQFTEDAIVMPPNGDAITGRAAIREFWVASMAFAPGGGITTEENGSSGDLAYERGSYVAEGPDGAHLDHGKYLSIWKLVDGEWKIYRDTWNTSMPAPEADASE
jgi:uncharacterized protein (TIGR02246 family)